MIRLPKNSLKSLRSKVDSAHRKTISIQLLSDYLSGRKRPGPERCLILAKASKRLGYDFSASDWMFDPEKIRQALIDQNTGAAA